MIYKSCTERTRFTSCRTPRLSLKYDICSRTIRKQLSCADYLSISLGFFTAVGAPRQASHRLSCTTFNSEGSFPFREAPGMSLSVINSKSKLLLLLLLLFIALQYTYDETVKKKVNYTINCDCIEGRLEIIQLPTYRYLAKYVNYKQ